MLLVLEEGVTGEHFIDLLVLDMTVSIHEMIERASQAPFKEDVMFSWLF